MSVSSQQHKSSVNGVVHCKANDILNGNDDLNIKKKQEIPKCYDNMLDYCLEVAKGLVQRQAFYTIDLADILRKVQMWREHLPNVEIFYAVKANDDCNILKLLVLLGLSFDCANEAEIRMVLDAGADPSNIIFAHTIKTKEELQFASKVRVHLMTFDNEDELYKIHETIPNASLVLRLTPAEVNCQFDLSDKFGCSMEDVVPLLKIAQKLRLNVVGVSFHVGALCPDAHSYTSTIKDCRWVFDKAADMGFKFSILDIGGGFFGSSIRDPIFFKVSEAIRKSINEHFPSKNIRVIAEPGCYIVGSAANLICTVIGKKTVKCEGENGEKKCYYLNEGVYGSFFKDILTYDIALTLLLPSSELKSRPSFPTKLFGQTCCSEDVLPFSGPLTDLKVGELMLWENMGAYNHGIASTFCGALIPLRMPIFVKNQRLNTGWIENKKAIMKFLREKAAFIGFGENDVPHS